MAVATATILLNGKERTWAAIPNPSLLNKDGTKKSTLDHVIDFCKSTNGAFRLIQFLERLTKIAMLILLKMGSHMAAFCENLAGKFMLTWAMMGIARLPDVSRKAWTAVTQWITPPSEAPLDADRDNIEKLHDITDAAAAWWYALALIVEPAFRKVADAFNLVADVTDLQTSTQDWYLAKQHLEVIDSRARNTNNDAIHDMFASKMRSALISMVKATSSVASGVLGLMVMALGGPILPPAALVAISTTSTVSAMFKHGYEETSPYKMPDFFKPIRNPQPLIVGVRNSAVGA